MINLAAYGVCLLGILSRRGNINKYLLYKANFENVVFVVFQATAKLFLNNRLFLQAWTNPPNFEQPNCRPGVFLGPKAARTPFLRSYFYPNLSFLEAIPTVEPEDTSLLRLHQNVPFSATQIQ